ncbi:MAG: glutamate-1-semialdehyde 2,1-aminomutase [Cellulomonadaceae bacterium]|jgi:glutamate-1-semialdehyde 2,1-aminomutase|nr:glutamate-1-semialdehyde 2,1-aminomutase [Cellulomonadaceae bacterium]
MTSTVPSLFEAAQRVMPGGVSSPVRAYRSVGGDPVFIASAAGAFVTGADGNEYLDFVGSWGPALLGHAHPNVVAAVQSAAQWGLSFGAPTTAETALAEAIIARIPVLDKVRFTSTGTEACMTAIRLARGCTGRNLVIKFAGCYHGHSDALLAEAGSGVATQGLPGSAGVTPGATQDTLVLPYNDLPALEATFAQHGAAIAAVITEPCAANMGLVPPAPGWNTALRRLTAQHGALLIYDEVLTGFRASATGWWGIEGQPCSWEPDLFTFGKVIGGGMPLAALAGRADIMDHLAPVGAVYQAGTLSGNPLATASGLATLKLATADVYAGIGRWADQAVALLEERLTAASIPHAIQRGGTLFSVFFGEDPASRAAGQGSRVGGQGSRAGVARPNAVTTGAAVTNYAQAQRQDVDLFARFHRAMREAGVLLPPSAFETWFVSAAHGERELEMLNGALGAALPSLNSNQLRTAG